MMNDALASAARSGSAPPEVTDQELMQRLCARDLPALELLHDRHMPAALGLDRRVLRDRSYAEDVVQDAFLIVWRKPDRYDPSRGSVRAWLLAIVYHRSIDKIRRLRAAGIYVELTPNIVDRSQADPAVLAVTALECERVRGALEQLPAEQRQAIELSFLQGRSHTEIAALMNCPLGTVKGRIRIGLDKLRAMMPAPELTAA
jgi:RNA polymerase sigma-70 factor (ECF subfamily)